MKIRAGFVSNSSSSSFICEICYETGVLYDSSLEEIGFCQCENYHIMCINHTKENIEKDENNYISKKDCPICSLTDLRWVDELSFYRIITNSTKEQALEHIKEKFETYEEFQEFLRKR